ncbi:hypothetical protein PCANC_03103 [Puccinia coronata f. sp. avenae]|uniref:Uncharacterized protein n=1 Tax=Puccinia coronata f. sp. avenae TaxID=200324 RepID=A0A2N5S2W5_9BASI|nr:hypothetical protein PCASD_23894 [Puccinia coronata f. sp. avenae]PLW21040.1 hypothetical protein PCANC_07347 [Puccinia coronata f. sp. avenae]PLW32853.1 hypothetical protein PCASD_13968 [Puccinia coronata f. sp. avenae]PLW57169.1 hypothetical protein PCANC_03103 [Puccinia coronata f. sp. avenae]
MQSNPGNKGARSSKGAKCFTPSNRSQKNYTYAKKKLHCSQIHQPHHQPSYLYQLQ